MHQKSYIGNRRKAPSKDCWLQDMHNEIQDVLGQSFAVPDGLDEDDLLEELDALEDEMANELESGNRAGVPSYLQVSFSLLHFETLQARHRE